MNIRMLGEGIKWPFFFAMVLLTIVTIVSSCKKEDDIAVTCVTVSPTTLDLTEGGTSTIAATVAPSDATHKEITWSSSITMQ